MSRLGPRLLLACLVVWGGCSAGLTGYVAEQAWGQLRIMNQRRLIREVLRRPDLSADWRVKLELVLLVRDYAHEELGLRRSGAYTYFYDTGGKPLAYNLSACPPDSLRPRLWRFPIVGALPYLGFFHRAEGVARQRALKAEGLDTYLRPVPAFSSLGWFADPIYSPLLQEEIPRLIDVVIHETTHTTIFLRGQVAFNESLAMFVGSQGTLNLLARMYGPTSEEVRQYVGGIVRRQRFARLVSALYRQLEQLYAGPLAWAEKLRRREALFTRAQQQYREIVPDPALQGSFGTRRLNNAVLLSYGRYNQGIEFHRRVYRRLGRDLARLVALYRRAQLFDDPIGYVERVTGVVRTTGQQMWRAGAARHRDLPPLFATAHPGADAAAGAAEQPIRPAFGATTGPWWTCSAWASASSPIRTSSAASATPTPTRSCTRRGCRRSSRRASWTTPSGARCTRRGGVRGASAAHRLCPEERGQLLRRVPDRRTAAGRACAVPPAEERLAADTGGA